MSKRPLHMRMRCVYRKLEFWVYCHLAISERLTQHCDRCGRIDTNQSFWTSDYLWQAIKDKAQDYPEHGCYCISCFDRLASDKGIMLMWVLCKYPNSSQWKRLRRRMRENSEFNA